ncbi:hypothetical protein AB0F96_06415 [Streptomyces sp. NPDC023998]|uniref:hypothetical protein n=1 Tax=Streptomyces sp. NPDC023998 TaxID=3154597 RepID=UPI0033D6F621
MAGARSYAYVGPDEIRDAVRPGSGGRIVRTPGGFEDWVTEQTAEELAEPFTYVVDAGGDLRLAPRRSEHVACAGGGLVIGAGEIAFSRGGNGWAISEVSNQSTGYCPDLDSWPAVAEALDRVGIGRPDGFTYEVVFRRCVVCGEVNVVREDDFVCVFCGGGLPASWNIA